MWEKKNRQRGFSIPELFTVIAIIGVLAGMATLSADYIRREQLSSTTRTLLADLQLTRGRSLTSAPSEAMPNMRGFGVNFISPTSYSTFTFDDSVGVSYHYDDPAEAANVKTTTLPSSIHMSIGGAITPSNQILIFDRFGFPKTATWSIGNITIVLTHQSLSASSYAKCIAVSESRIREGNWNVASNSCTLQ